MKSPLAYYLLLLYITVMFKPLIPVVSDALAHTFNESIHIGTVHAIYGSHHLAMDVASTAPTDNNQHQTSQQQEETIPLHIIAQNDSATLLLINIAIIFALFRIRKRSAVYINIQLPPPKLSL